MEEGRRDLWIEGVPGHAVHDLPRLLRGVGGAVEARVRQGIPDVGCGPDPRTPRGSPRAAATSPDRLLGRQRRRSRAAVCESRGAEGRGGRSGAASRASG